MAHSVAPPSQPMVASSPMPVRGQPLKRVVSARGVSSLAPRLSHSASGQFLTPSLDSDKGASELFRHFSLSTSRRSVASSPTESWSSSSASLKSAPSSVANVTVGFTVNSSQHSGLSHLPPIASNVVSFNTSKSKAAPKGLLSRALTLEDSQVHPQRLGFY